MIYFFSFLALVFIVIIMLPQLKGWRTTIWASIVAGVPLLSEVFSYLNAFKWENYVDKSYLPFILIGVGVSFAILRKLTTKPMGNG